MNRKLLLQVTLMPYLDIRERRRTKKSIKRYHTEKKNKKKKKEIRSLLFHGWTDTRAVVPSTQWSKSDPQQQLCIIPKSDWDRIRILSGLSSFFFFSFFLPPESSRQLDFCSFMGRRRNFWRHLPIVSPIRLRFFFFLKSWVLVFFTVCVAAD